MKSDVDVLIVGAGPSGLVLACDLQRRGVTFRLIDASMRGFEGSRAKGVQPRTLEVLDDLGVLSRLQSRSMLYPPLGLHLGPLTFRRTMIKLHAATPDVPHSNTLLAPQYATDLSLRERLEELGAGVNYSTRLLSFTQHEGGIVAQLETAEDTEEVRARYIIGADGGSSAVRRALGIPFRGTTDESDRMIVADVDLTGISSDRWHIWPRKQGRFVALCPLPGGKFQLMLKLRPQDSAEMDAASIENLVRDAIGSRKVRIHRIHWSSVWRPNIRLAERYRVGRALLVGDAAHVHPPTGAQGLNTGVQDAYNLGWKIGQVLAGGDDELLDTYEAERQPVATRVLGLASGLYAHIVDAPLTAMKRGDEERQLALTYRGGPLASNVATDEKVDAGDRAPDSPVTLVGGEGTTLFDLFRGPSFTVLAIGARALDALAPVRWSGKGAVIKTVVLDDTRNNAFRDIYGTPSDALLLIRPDGYVAARATGELHGVLDWPSLPFFPPSL
ncbi:FAD-dependent monooxygenase [Microbacterium sp.]|uniref:FAD-dependent monooxygenase n=1 Tax=Microbacterium sp. TaxID=51671 RepID=UPI003567DF00